jgi:hypothetical protein
MAYELREALRIARYDDAAARNTKLRLDARNHKRTDVSGRAPCGVQVPAILSQRSNKYFTALDAYANVRSDRL